MKIRTLLLSAAILLSLTAVGLGQGKNEKGFKTIFDGKTFTGWKKAEENPDTWTIKEGALVAAGPRNHLYYVGDPKPLVNFELKIDAMTEPGSNGGVYFHTEYQPKGRRERASRFRSTRRTPIGRRPAASTTWSTSGSSWSRTTSGTPTTSSSKTNTSPSRSTTRSRWIGNSLADRKAGENFTRIIDKGTIALQAHDPKSVSPLQEHPREATRLNRRVTQAEARERQRKTEREGSEHAAAGPKIKPRSLPLAVLIVRSIEIEHVVEPAGKKAAR